MSSLVLCPDCKRKLKVPDTAVGKTIRCPACKALIPTVSEPEVDPEDSDADIAARPRSVKSAPPPRSAPARPRSRPPRDEEREDEDDEAPAVEKPIRKKSPGRRRPSRKKSSLGLVIGLAVGGVFLLLVLLVVGVGLFRHFAGNPTISEAEWQTFTPPNSDCSVLMPGTPVLKSQTTNGVTVNMYLLERNRGGTAFVVAFMSLGNDPLKPNALELVTNAMRDETARRMNGKATSESAVTLGNLPGREFQISTPKGGVLTERLYLAKVGGAHRAYIVGAGSEKGQLKEGDSARFFASFKVVASAAPPTFLDAPAGPGQPPPPFVNPPPANPQPQPPRRPRPPNLPRRN